MTRLLSKKCQNQGYVLDGYPKTLEQTIILFGRNGEEEEDAVGEEDKDEEVETGIREIKPDLIISLEACDEFLKKRVIDLPERDVQGTHYSAEHMLRRLREYRYKHFLSYYF